MKSLYIYHESGSKSHFRALLWRQDEVKDIKLIFREFEITKKIIKSFYKFDLILLKKQFINIFFFFSLFFKKNKNIIVGITPYNWKLFLIYPLLKKNNYFFFTSRTVWGYKKYSRIFLAKTKLSKKVWTSFIENASGIFCVNKQGLEEILKYYKVKNISLVNHSIDPLYVSNTFLKPKNKKIKCLFVGRFTKPKGIDIILQIINQIDDQSFEFHFVGRGELEEILNKFCNKNSNSFNHGFLKGENLRNIYLGSDIILLPSQRQRVWEELFGMVLIESMSCGCLPITTDHAGPKEIIENEKCGFIFPEQNYIENTIEKLDRLINDKEYLRNLQEQAFQRGKSYAPNKVFHKWNHLLNIENE